MACDGEAGAFEIWKLRDEGDSKYCCRELEGGYSYRPGERCGRQQDRKRLFEPALAEKELLAIENRSFNGNNASSLRGRRVVCRISVEACKTLVPLPPPSPRRNNYARGWQISLTPTPNNFTSSTLMHVVSHKQCHGNVHNNIAAE